MMFSEEDRPPPIVTIPPPTEIVLKEGIAGILTEPNPASTVKLLLEPEKVQELDTVMFPPAVFKLVSFPVKDNGMLIEISPVVCTPFKRDTLAAFPLPIVK